MLTIYILGFTMQPVCVASDIVFLWRPPQEL